MRIVNRFWLGGLALVGLFVTINLIILAYGILQQYPAAQISLIFLCLVLGFGTDHWRTRKLNSKILNPYHNGRK